MWGAFDIYISTWRNRPPNRNAIILEKSWERARTRKSSLAKQFIRVSINGKSYYGVRGREEIKAKICCSYAIPVKLISIENRRLEFRTPSVENEKERKPIIVAVKTFFFLYIITTNNGYGWKAEAKNRLYER